MSEETRQLVYLVVLDRHKHILVNCSGASVSLPKVEIPRFTRLAHSVTLAALEKYGLNLFLILSSQVTKAGHISTTNGANALAAVCRLQMDSLDAPAPLTWLDPVHAATRLVVEDQRTLTVTLHEFESYDSGAKASSFGRYRALDELREWYTPQLATLGLREINIKQWNGDPWFALFRIGVEPVGEIKPDSPAALWFKAVGEPNTREFAITNMLSKECPWWFSKVVAIKPEVNGWLAEEVSGHELDIEPDGRPWALTARILAKVQTIFTNCEDRLLDFGCADWRIPRIVESIDPFFESMIEVTARQPKSPPAILGREELREMAQACRDLCYQVEDTDIPYSIAHGDFSPHNVIVKNGWPVLIDWAEAYVTFPFISWEYFWNRTIKDHPNHAEWRERMHRNYAYRSWTSLLGRSRVDAGLRLSPAMAVLVHALQGSTDPARGAASPLLDKVNRSLLRRLQRELELLQPAGVL
jgi:hypothetical protein